MPRIRSVKPQFWVSEQVMDCSRDARLLFIGLWNFCDDAGRHPAKIRTLLVEVFPGDGISTKEGEVWIQELVAAGLLFEYESEGEKYWQVTGWNHQKIDRPNKRYPSPDSTNDRRAFDEDSANSRRVVDERSPPEEEEEEEEEEEKEEEKEKEPPKSPKGESSRPVKFAEIDFPDSLAASFEFTQTFEEWWEYRKERKLSRTQRTVKAQLRKLAKVGPEVAVQMMEDSIANGYQGLFEPRGVGARKANQVGHTKFSKDVEVSDGTDW